MNGRNALWVSEGRAARRIAMFLIGGPLALVRDGDIVRIDAAGRRMDLLLGDAEIAARRAA